MSQLLDGFRDYVVVFLAVITAIVFVHELGHFLVARACGVRVETFSIGFGPELFGWTGKSGTRWRVSLLPLGGYVRMYGDLDGPGDATDKLAAMTPEQRAVAFRSKTVAQRAAIVAAGPAINFVLGIAILATLFTLYGQPHAASVVGEVQPGSAAADAGLKVGDKIVEANDEKVDTFQDLQRIVRLTVGEPVVLRLERDGQAMTLSVQPRMTEIEDAYGGKQKVPLLGVAPSEDAVTVTHFGPAGAVIAATQATWEMVSINLKAMGQMIAGRRNSDQISGPLGIANQVGKAARHGFLGVAQLMALISISLGLVNLFPIPLLDGGHLLFYGVETVLGRPLGQRAQEYGFRVGLFLVLALMVLATGNDLGIWKLIRGVVS
jgi:regulator of sigma E protease